MPFVTGLKEGKGGDQAGARRATGLGVTCANKASQQTSDNVVGYHAAWHSAPTSQFLPNS